MLVAALEHLCLKIPATACFLKIENARFKIWLGGNSRLDFGVGADC
jgi:hypothetical protein